MGVQASFCSTLCRVPGYRVAGLPCDTKPKCLAPLVTIQYPVLQYKPPQPPAASVTIQILYRDTAFPSQLLLLSQYTKCIVTQSSPSLPSLRSQYNNCIVYRDTAFPSQLLLLSQYTKCIVTQSSPGLPSLRSQYNNCIVTQCSSPNSLPLSQYTPVYCDTLPNHPSCLSHNTLSLFATLLVTIQSVYCDPIPQPTFLLQYKSKVAIQIFFFPFCNTLLPITHPKA